jgi:hypothetical protein
MSHRGHGEQTLYPNLKRAKIWAMSRMGRKGNKKKRDKKADLKEMNQ